MRIKFLRHCNQYNAGEFADFDEAEATRLVQHEYAEFVAPADGMIDEAPVSKETLAAAASGISPMPYKRAPRDAALGPDMTDEQRAKEDARREKEGKAESVSTSAHDEGSSRGPRTDGGDEARLRLRTSVPLKEEDAVKAAEARKAETDKEEAAKAAAAKERTSKESADEPHASDLPGRGNTPRNRKG